MIARTWQGWASPETAAAYEQYYSSEVAEHLSSVPGFIGGHLLRRADGDSILFTSITFFSDWDAIRTFAGPDPSRAMVGEQARRVLLRWEDQVFHHDVSANIHLDAARGTGQSPSHP